MKGGSNFVCHVWKIFNGIVIYIYTYKKKLHRNVFKVSAFYMWQYLLVGIISGILTGSIGGGGQVVIVPLLMYCGLSFQEGVAISLAVNAVPQSAPGLYLYYKKGDFKLREAIFVIIGALIGVFFGSYLVIKYKLTQKTLSRFLSFLMIFLGILVGYIYG
jgi:hypothetical protein